MENLKVNLVNGETFGNFTIADDVKGRNKESSALTFEHGADSGSITLDTATTLPTLCGTIADSIAAGTDVPTLTTDFNALLAALRTANIIG